jgi:hypothetical protein
VGNAMMQDLKYEGLLYSDLCQKKNNKKKKEQLIFETEKALFKWERGVRMGKRKEGEVF